MVVEIEYLATVGMDKPRWVVIVDESDLWRSVARVSKWRFEAVQIAENVENNLK